MKRFTKIEIYDNFLKVLQELKRIITKIEIYDNFLKVLQELKRIITLYTKRFTRVKTKRMKRTITL